MSVRERGSPLMTIECPFDWKIEVQLQTMISMHRRSFLAQLTRDLTIDDDIVSSHLLVRRYEFVQSSPSGQNLKFGADFRTKPK